MNQKDKPEKNFYDVAIVGGGLAGMSLACLLGTRGMRVVCIDALDPAQKPQDLRTTAISYGSRKILERAGIWDNVKEFCPIEDIQILDGDSPLLLQFLSLDVEGKAFGWICDNHDLKQAMMMRMQNLQTISHIAPAQVQDFEIQNDTGRIVLKSGTHIQARLIVGADGRTSFTRNWMVEQYGLQVRQWSYNQSAVVCCVRHEHPHNNVAVEHFWPEGPFAILPMADDQNGTHRSSVVFTEHGPEKKSWMRLSDADFEAVLTERFPPTYGKVQMVGKRARYPLSLVHAAEYIGPRMALVADAAHGIHPIAGQGLNLGFRDLGTLDELLGAAFASGKDLGAPELLERYQQLRRPDNMAMVAVTDALVRLFSNNFAPVRFARRAGLKLVGRLKPAKRFFMRQAMGDRSGG
jgi:2-octaprenyl-6-methoxyphenol hydroxylase